MPYTNYRDKRVTIIGGGITGLSAAYIAAKSGHEVTVLEGSPRLGGLVSTFPIGGNRLEQYYHHFFTHDRELFWLLKELNLSDDVEFKKTAMGVFCNNRIYDFNTVKDLFGFSPMRLPDKVRFGLSSLYLGRFANWRRWEGVSALDWFYAYAGRRATESLWKPMLQVKFGPYAEEVPVSWMVGRLRQRLNSRKDGEERLGYLKGSLQRLLDTLSDRLQSMGVKVMVKAKVNRLLIENGGLLGVETTRGKFCEGIFLATIPSIYLIPLLKGDVPDYAAELSKIRYFGAVCTVLVLDRPFSHIYWLNVADSGFPFGGIIEHTNFIPPSEYNGNHIVYLSRYFDQADTLSTASTAQIKYRMLEQLTRINPSFDRSWVKNIYVFRTHTAATVCDLNFSEKVPSYTTPIGNLYLANMSHVYPDERSCNNSIKVAVQACKRIGMDTSMVPSGPSLAGQIGME